MELFQRCRKDWDLCLWLSFLMTISEKAWITGCRDTSESFAWIQLYAQIPYPRAVPIAKKSQDSSKRARLLSAR